MSTALTTFERKYVAKKALFTFLGNAFRFYGPDNQLRFYVKQKAFKLKEDIAVYTEEAMQNVVLRIKARNILDTSATYDILDEATGSSIGALRRRGLKSILRDEWAILDSSDGEVGTLMEDSMGMAILRRLFGKGLIPQHFVLRLGDEVVGKIDGRFNPFQLAYDVDFSAGEGKLDPRLGVAATVLMLAIEGRQG
jgi:uncharacterized protein YxjI